MPSSDSENRVTDKIGLLHTLGFLAIGGKFRRMALRGELSRRRIGRTTGALPNNGGFRATSLSDRRLVIAKHSSDFVCFWSVASAEFSFRPRDSWMPTNAGRNREFIESPSHAIPINHARLCDKWLAGDGRDQRVPIIRNRVSITASGLPLATHTTTTSTPHR